MTPRGASNTSEIILEIYSSKAKMQGKVPEKSMQHGDRHSALSLQALRNLFQVEELPVIARNY